MDSHPGMALVLDVQVNADILEIIKIKASGKLELNTSNTARTLAGVHMNAQSFVLALSGEVRFLEVIKFDASFLLEVGYDGVGSWRVEFRASMDFFGLATLQAHGMFNYKGHFDFTLDGRVILGTDSFGLRADFHFRVAFGEREDPENPGLNEFFFLVEASASAKLRAFGITFGGVSIAFSLTAHGSGRVPLVIDARASIDFAFFSIGVHMKFTLGYIELPKPVYLAGNPTGDPRLWDPVAANGGLGLTMGARNAERGIGEGEDDEMYIIEHAGSTADGEIVRVIFSGRETLFKGVKKIVAFGGAGDDHIYVKEGVTSDVELHGGDGNDVFVYEGSGRATMFGDAGDDYLQTGVTSTVAFLYGGADDDFILHTGSGRAEIDGGPGRDRLFGGPANDLIHGGDGSDEIDGGGGVDEIYGDGGDDFIHWDYQDLALGTVNGGAGNDMLQIVVLPGADELAVNSLGGNRFQVVETKNGATVGSITGTSIEKLSLDARGGADRITLGYMAGSGLNFIELSAGKQVVKTGTETVQDPTTGQPIDRDRVSVSDDRAADTIRIVGSAGGDTLTLSDYNAGGVSGIGIVFAGAGLGGGSLQIVVSNSVRGEGDTLIIDTLDGNDHVDASAVTVDRAALRVIGGEGDDTLVATRFDDYIDSGRGSDTVTGGLGFDVFVDSSPSATNGIDDDGDGRIDEADENEIDTLVETFDFDVGLYNDKLVMGHLLAAGSSTVPFAAGKTVGDELTDPGDHLAAGAIVEDLKNQFEAANITGGAGNNTLVVNDLDRSITVGNTRLSVINWRGYAVLDNGGATGSDPEHYLVTVPACSHAVVEIADRAGANHRLMITATDQADTFVLDTITPLAGLTGQLTASGSSQMQILHRGVEAVEIDSRAGDDRFTIKAIHTRTAINASSGDDLFSLGNDAHTLNDINALLIINGQGSGDHDVMTLDDTGDTGNNYGTLTSSTIINGVSGFGRLMDMDGSITYGTLEALEIHLGNAATGNVFTDR